MNAVAGPPAGRVADIALTALAPAVWGSTYYVATEFLPQGHPLTVAALRALPAGLLLLLVTRRAPRFAWLGRIAILGALNFTVFWWLLFEAAYRLPGGVAATLGATQALVVILLARWLLGSPIRLTAILAAVAGAGGVALLVLTPDAALDPLGLAAGLGGAVSMAAGTVLSRKWSPPVPALTFTAWQLTAGGLMLAPLALAFEPPPPTVEPRHVIGLAYLCLIGAAATYALWFRGIARLEPSAVSMLGMFSPVTAVALGWALLGQSLDAVQLCGAALVLAAVWVGQQAASPRPV